jgi:GT2 family glycosyltransferase
MKFSVVIPAFNAAETISTTLDSIRSQTYGEWQAVIIDDGSTDATPSIAQQYCKEDSRFILLQQSNSGLSAARNTGIAAAKYDHLLFLDADDWIHPEYLAKFAHEFDVNPDIDAVVCGWQFMLENGTGADIRYPPDTIDMFPFFSHTCPFVVHSCVVNRRVIEHAGVFDSNVGFVEDWDFWQRISRSGARFTLVREVLAYYRMRKGSLSRKVFQSYNDARKMIYQGYAPDQRVSYPVEKYRNGMPDNKLNEHLCWLYCWYAGLCLGVGESVERILVPDLSGFAPEPKQLATFIFEAVYRGGCFLPGEWMAFFQEHKEVLEKFFALLEDKTGTISAIHDSKIALWSMIAHRSSGGQMQMVGEILYLPIDVNKPVGGVKTTASGIVLSVCMDGFELGKVDLSAENGHLSEEKLKQAVGQQFAWPLMTNYLQHRNIGVPREELEGGLGWELFLQELWGLKCSEPDFYDKSYEDNSAYDTIDWGDPIRVDVENKLFHIRNEGRSLNVDYYIGGVKLGNLVIQEEGPIVKAQVIRAAISAHGKFELCKAAVTQGLIGKVWKKMILREELKRSSGSEM